MEIILKDIPKVYGLFVDTLDDLIETEQFKAQVRYTHWYQYLLANTSYASFNFLVSIRKFEPDILNQYELSEYIFPNIPQKDETAFYLFTSMMTPSTKRIPDFIGEVKDIDQSVLKQYQLDTENYSYLALEKIFDMKINRR